MTIKPFKLEYFPLLQKWLDEHGHIDIALDELPALGYAVCTDTGVPLAMGFLRLAEGNMAIIDSIAGNPDAKPKEVSEAIDTLFEKLIQVATDLKIKYLVGATVKNSLVRRTTNEHGFVLSDFKLLVKKI
jgi:hypothetical protein